MIWSEINRDVHRKVVYGGKVNLSMWGEYILAEKWVGKSPKLIHHLNYMKRLKFGEFVGIMSQISYFLQIN